MPDLRHSRKKHAGWVVRTGHLCVVPRNVWKKRNEIKLCWMSVQGADDWINPVIFQNARRSNQQTSAWKRNCLGGSMYLMTLHGTTRRPLSERLKERLEKLDAKPSMLFCGQCETHKPNRMPYWKPGHARCRHCERIR